MPSRFKSIFLLHIHEYLLGVFIMIKGSRSCYLPTLTVASSKEVTSTHTLFYIYLEFYIKLSPHV